MAKIIRAETQEIVPRYYGLSFPHDGVRIFDNPSTAALALVAITSPEKQGGLRDMLREWQARKKAELEGRAGYAPLFKLTPRQANKLLGCSLDELVGIVREAIQKNHGSYNLWDAYGSEAVSDLTLRGELLTARVRSQGEGWYSPVVLKGAVRGASGELRYHDVSCKCDDSDWTETKGGKGINYRHNCIHVKAMESDSFLQDTRTQPASRNLMREKDAHKGRRSLTFDFIRESGDPFLKPLIADVLIAREVLGQSAYEIDRKLLSQIIGPAITPISLQEEVVNNRAAFEVMKHKRRVREIDSNVLAAQRTVDAALSSLLRKAGYSWQGHCLELGREADRYEDGIHAVSIVQGNLPFYVVRNLQNARRTAVFAQDYAPQNPFQIPLLPHQRIDDRTRKLTDSLVVPAVTTKGIPGVPEISLRYDIPLAVITEYRKAIRANVKNPETILKALRVKY